jgi:hypothetical protein
VELQKSQGRVALRADFDEDLELVPNEDITGDRDIVIGGLILEGDLGLNAENKGSASQKR